MCDSIIKDERREELDSLMQKGYAESLKGNSAAACALWSDFWTKIKETMQAYGAASMEEQDKAFHGTQSISNWAQDFEMELDKASAEDKRFLQERIDFCREYITRSKVKDDLNNLVRKRVIAESYFLLGNAEEGEKLFKEYVQQHPKDGWGWINWSDQYGIFAREEHRDNEKAIAILKQGLNVKGLEERSEVFLRLEDLYSALNMTKDARDAKQKAERESEEEKAQRLKSLRSSNRNTEQHFPKNKPVTVQKVGRNDPCPCGSDKKYKKCCGR